MFLDIYKGHIFSTYSFQLAPPILHTIQIEIEFTSSNEFGIIFWPIFIINIDHDSNLIFYYIFYYISLRDAAAKD